MKNPIARLFILLISLCIAACSAPASQQNANAGKTFKLKVQPPKGSTTKIVTFQRATVYTGSTDYYFLEKSGQDIRIRQSNFEDNPFTMPEGLLESGEASEGPAGANPEMIGQAFILTYDEKGRVIKVEKQ